jgi:hypothetical protein
MSYDDLTYRITYMPDNEHVEVMPFGAKSRKRLERGDYRIDDLPDSIQDKLAVLAVLHVPPPPCDVPGVGCRINARTFWVYD